MVKSKTTWDLSSGSLTGPADIKTLLDQFIAEGKTDGTPTVTEEGNVRTVERSWTDTESAQAWVDRLKEHATSAIVE
jgi:hypothetical protein